LLGLLAGALALLFTWLLLKAGVILAAQAFPAEYGTLIFDVTPNLKIWVRDLRVANWLDSFLVALFRAYAVR
jgi:hypothetical protein